MPRAPRKSISQTRQSKAEHKRRAAHFERFGRFVNSFARVETAVHVLFQRCAGLDDSAARVISGGQRLTDLMNIIRRLIRLGRFKGGAPIGSAVGRLFDQISAVAKLRDMLVHRGADFDTDGGVSVTNRLTARAEEDVELLQINARDIVFANTDCAVIMGMLAVLAFENDHDRLREAASQVERYAWLYKHRQPDTPNRPRRRTLQ